MFLDYIGWRYLYSQFLSAEGASHLLRVLTTSFCNFDCQKRKVFILYYIGFLNRAFLIRGCGFYILENGGIRLNGCSNKGFLYSQSPPG